MTADVRICDLARYIGSETYPHNMPDHCFACTTKAMRLLAAYIDVSTEEVEHRMSGEDMRKKPYTAESVMLTFLARDAVFFETEEDLCEALNEREQEAAIRIGEIDDDETDDEANDELVIIISDDDQALINDGASSDSPTVMAVADSTCGQDEGNGEVLDDLLNGEAIWLDDGFIIPENEGKHKIHFLSFIYNINSMHKSL